jgi:putative lipoprotein
MTRHHRSSRLHRYALYSLLAALLAACGGKQPPARESTAMSTLDTEVSYRERVLLPPGTTLSVSLEDVSRMDIASVLIAQEQLLDPGAPPYLITLSYDPAQIEARHRYTVRAAIRQGEQLLFTSTQHIDPFAADAAEPVAIPLQRTPRPPAGTEAGPQTPALVGSSWELTQLGGETPEVRDPRARPTLHLLADAGRVAGNAGCNRFAGSYHQEETGGLRFDQLASTRKACPEGMELEQHFLAMLGEVRGYTRDGDALHLTAADGATLASFRVAPSAP